MSCNHPRHAFKTGRITDNGKDEYIITDHSVNMLSFADACMRLGCVLTNCHTEIVNGIQFLVDPIEIPCGSCFGCRMARSREWSVRLALEREYYKDDECFFLTLTYDDAHLPKSLCMPDLQRFWKRLRKLGFKFRYFACGEYGEETLRPHYHAIVYGLKLEDLRYHSLSDKKSPLFVSKTISKCWPFGLHAIGYADSASLAYVAGYCEKKQLDPHWSSYPVKPFIVMSRKPAIGTRSMLDQKDSIISTNSVYGQFGSSHTAPVPRHFIRKLGEEDEFWKVGRSIAARGRAEKARDLEHAVYGTTDDYKIGDIKDSLILLNISRMERS